MRFSELKGCGSLPSVLGSMADTGRVPHAILLHEDDGGGGIPLALSFLQYLYCRDRHDGDSCASCPDCNKVSKLIHPDIRFVFPTVNPGKDTATKSAVSQDLLPQWRELVLNNPYFLENEFIEVMSSGNKQLLIAIGEARGVINTLSLSAVEGGWRSVLVYLPEKMNAPCANTLLKMIEEPPEKTLFLMVTHSPEDVITTIRSRCLCLRVPPPPAADYALVHPSGSGERIRLEDIFKSIILASLSKDLLSALESAEEAAALPSREQQKAALSCASDILRTIFLIQQGLIGADSLPEEDREFYATAASSCRKSFPRLALQRLDRAVLLLERNVNQKIIFCNLADFIYVSV